MTIQAIHAGTSMPLVPSPQLPALSASGGGTPELKQAFTDFVGQTFFGELLKQMRATVGKPAYMHGGFGEDVFQSQLDQVLVERISDSTASTFSDPMYQLLLARRP
jgi:peptidoglycan hydrolase FlgJ